MTDGWRAVNLGHVIAESREKVRVECDTEYPLAGVLGFGRGMLFRDPVRGSDISAQHLYRIRAGQVIYSRLKAFEGAFALVPARAEGRFVSNEFPTFDVDESLVAPDYLALILRRPRVWQELESGSEGMGARRERLQPSDFLELEFDLPPLDDQRRITAAVAIAERAFQAHERKARAARRTHATARQELIEGPDFDRVSLEDVVVAVKGGKSPQCLNRPPTQGEYGVLKVSSIRDGHFRPDEAKALPAGVTPAADSVRKGDLLYSRANTVTLVGAMCRVDRDYPNLLLCDKTMRVTLNTELAEPDYIVEAVATSVAREHIETLAGGTSESMKNISQEAFLATEVALPPVADQRRIACVLRTLRHAGTAADRRRLGIARLRQALVEELVAGVLEAPELRITL